MLSPEPPPGLHRLGAVSSFQGSVSSVRTVAETVLPSTEASQVYRRLPTYPPNPFLALTSPLAV